MIPYSQRKNTTSRISLARILFEDEGGGDYATGSGSDNSSGLEGYTGGYGGGGGGGGESSGLKKAFIDPFKTLFGALGYSIEKVVNASYYFAKKILVNIPRLFNPVTPLIFDDIRDEEKAAYGRLDKRYAEVLKQVNENLKNNDIKAFAFLLAPQQVLTAAFVATSPKIAWKTANVLTGNKLNDLVTTVKNAYYSTPGEQRSQERIQQLIRQYEENSGRTGRQPLEENRAQRAKQGQVTSEEFFAKFFPLFQEYVNRETQPAIESIQNIGEESIKELFNKINAKAIAVEAALAKKTPEEFASAVGTDINTLKSQIDKAIDDTINAKGKKPKGDQQQTPAQNPEKTKEEVAKQEETRKKVAAQINAMVLGQLKSNYINKIRDDLIKSENTLTVLKNIVPKELTGEIVRIIANIDRLLNNIKKPMV